MCLFFIVTCYNVTMPHTFSARKKTCKMCENNCHFTCIIHDYFVTLQLN